MRKFIHHAAAPVLGVWLALGFAALFIGLAHHDRHRPANPIAQSLGVSPRGELP